MTELVRRKRLRKRGELKTLCDGQEFVIVSKQPGEFSTRCFGLCLWCSDRSLRKELTESSRSFHDAPS